MSPDEIKQLRKTLGMTQTHLARALGVETGTVNKWENGKHKPSPMAVRMMRHLLQK